MAPGFIGVDVGTGSVRAGLFSGSGSLIAVSVKEIEINNPEPGFYQQSSDEIWKAVSETIQEIVGKKGGTEIKAISFCATCSLVAIGSNNEPISVCKSKNPPWNVMMWMDHRAKEEAEQINATKHKVLSSVGGSISLEMQTPKILWLKKNLSESFQNTNQYFDLSDYLRWRATGSLKRSVCSLVCKWTFVNEPSGKHCWDGSYFAEIGLTDGIRKFGSEVSFPGDSDLISREAALELRLPITTRVGFSMIDAHAGVLGMIGCGYDSCKIPRENLLTSRLAIICGTSNCVLALSKKSIDVHGVWGPYYGVILNEYYVAEGGQSASGKLVDHVISSHKAYAPILSELGGSHSAVLSKLENILSEMKVVGDLAYLTKDLHLWPDFHGNRSPIADPSLKGMITGLSLSSSMKDLAILYLATIQSISYGTRHIHEALKNRGYEFSELLICGGLAKSALFLQTLSDVVGIEVVVPSCGESVILGAAISAAAAFYSATESAVAGSLPESNSVQEALFKMSGQCTRISPNLTTKSYHNRKYNVFLRMLQDQLTYREIMMTVTTY